MVKISVPECVLKVLKRDRSPEPAVKPADVPPPKRTRNNIDWESIKQMMATRPTERRALMRWRADVAASMQVASGQVSKWENQYAHRLAEEGKRLERGEVEQNNEATTAVGIYRRGVD